MNHPELYSTASEVDATDQLATQVDFSFLDYGDATDTAFASISYESSFKVRTLGTRCVSTYLAQFLHSRLLTHLMIKKLNCIPSYSQIGDAEKKQLDIQFPGISFEDGDAVHEELPPWACAYCGIHDPACVVRCISTGKWFCNGRTLSSASCIITHLVKSRLREVSLHRMSPLGETTLECYATGSRNVFALGYVPLKDENTVVILCRDIPASTPAIKDLNLDMTQWQALISDRMFVDWLVKQPGPEDMRRARRLTLEEVGQLEDLWRSGNTQATVADLMAAPVQEDDPLPVALRYEDAAAYDRLFGALISLEADYDRTMKENQVREGVTVQWSVALNKRYVARFYFPKDSTDLRLMLGKKTVYIL